MSWVRDAARWIRELGGRSGDTDAERAQPTAVASGRWAVLATEQLACERVVTGPARRAVAEAEGLVLSGLRASALLDDDGLGSLHAGLSAAVARRAPLVVHATCSPHGADLDSLGGQGHAGYHALSDTGAMLALARNVQHAVDLTLLAHRASELGLGPVVVAMEGPETGRAPQSVDLPDAKLVSTFLGRAGAMIDCPTPAQRILFGERRRRIPRFFDFDRPGLHGALQSGSDLAAGLAGQREFFGAELPGLLAGCMRELEQLTGRKSSFIRKHRLKKARHVFVAQGAAIDLAEAVADALNTRRDHALGVLGIQWLRPLASGEIRAALASAEVVTVLERNGDAIGGGGPLLREIRAALGDGAEPRVLHAVYGLGGQPLSASNLIALHENALLEDAARSSLLLGVRMPGDSPEHPKRQVFVERLQAAHEELAGTVLDIEVPFDLRPEPAKTVALWARRSALIDSTVQRLAELMGQHAGPIVRSRVTELEQSVSLVQVSAAKDRLRDPWDVVPVQALLIEAPQLAASANPVRTVMRGGAVLFGGSPPVGDSAASRSPAELWAALPASWRSSIRELELRVYTTDAGVAELVAHVPELLGAEASGVLERVEWSELADPERERAPRAPLAVRRFGKSRPRYDNLPRLWGEQVQPRLSGNGHPELDPHLSLAAGPPSTAALVPPALAPNRLPQIDAARCTGCGACWSACPDTAIAPALIGTQALLDAAADLAAKPGSERSEAASKLRRAHRQLAARIDGVLAGEQPQALSAQTLREGFEWLTVQMKIAEGELPAFKDAFDATLGALAPLPFSATAALFGEAQLAKQGSGELLALAVDPAACQGCGGCAAVCAEQAIRIEARSEPALRAARAGWALWEQLPDPSGESLARAMAHPLIGPLAGVTMSRHTLLSLAGASAPEAGSGERLALRQISAVAEYERQRSVLAELGQLEALSGRLNEALRRALGQAVSEADLELLARALSGQESSLGALTKRLDELGARAPLDGHRARRLLDALRGIDRLRAQLAGGEGPARARVGWVIADRGLASWAAELTHNPFSAPVVAELEAQGAALAIGLCEGLLERHTDQIRRVRRAELLALAPSDLPRKEAELEKLDYRQLSREELAHAPALIVVASERLLASEPAGLIELLCSDLPIKVVLLGEGAALTGGVDPLLPLLGLRRPFVVSSTVAHSRHLFEGLQAALRHPGPALVHMYAPSPTRHGFAADATVERARLAAECRVHPLLRYDPESPGVFGARLSLQENPALSEPWVALDGRALTPAQFAFGERRFDRERTSATAPTRPIAEWALEAADQRSATPIVQGPDESEIGVSPALARAVVERAETWRTLAEWAGVVTPFAERVRELTAHELQAIHRQELDAMRADYERRLAEVEQAGLARHTDRLRERLIELARNGATRATPEKPS
jgi:pyruvate-ferredoxin/flavodoxin oxidoreductase